VHGYQDKKVRVCNTCFIKRQKRKKEIEDRGVFVSERNSGGYGKITVATEVEGD
jgi:lipocalin